MEAIMAKKDTKQDAEQVKNTSGGGHLGGTRLGQQPDAKTSSTVKNEGDKARPNDGRN
jgi:hypothetical protein